MFERVSVEFSKSSVFFEKSSNVVFLEALCSRYHVERGRMDFFNPVVKKALKF